MSGHVFITLGDITHLECDAWLLPTDHALAFNPIWATVIEDLDARVRATDTADLEAQRVQATVLDNPAGEPSAVLATVPLDGVRQESDIEHIEGSIRDFTRAALERLGKPRQKRSKALLAVPNFGTGEGGGAHLRGLLAERLLDVCAEVAAEHDVDIAIVLRDERSFARMQALRKCKGGWHKVLTPEEYLDAQKLAELAKDGRLVPFLGAGTSVSAGAPSWSELLDGLAEGLGLDGDERAALSGWSELDRAAYLRQNVIQKEMAQGMSAESAAAAFSEMVAHLVDLRRYGLTPALLASLRAPHAITLNYDTLFERASEDAGMPRVQIPHVDGGAESGPWLLKLHGSVDKPESIVLTRDDYLGYASQREALSAIVKANLLTHHLLFVGFGLTDEHFHRIIYDVRRALPTDALMRDRATALTLTDDRIAAALWNDRVRMRPLPGEGGTVDGRAVEVFLDVLVACATDAHSYLLDDDFANSLSKPEARLRDALLELRASIDELEPGTAGLDHVEALLRDLGDEPQSPR